MLIHTYIHTLQSKGLSRSKTKYIYIYIYIYIHIDKKAIAEMKCGTEQTMKLEWLYKVGSECELNSWPDSSVG